MELLIIMIILISLCWGSFLAASAYRIAFEKPFFTQRSHCPSCNKVIAWYDNIPLFSWIILRGKCRSCKKKISLVYPFTEATTTIIMVALFVKFFDPYLDYFSFSIVPTHTIMSFLVYVFFFSALILSTTTDLQAMVIPQIATLWLIPVGIACSFLNLTDISPLESICGAAIGYGILWLIAFIFKKITKKDGMGVGDMELLGMIGSFIGPIGLWVTVMVGAIAGVVLGGIYLAITRRHHTTRIPFGPFLALGAVLFFFFEQSFIQFLMK